MSIVHKIINKLEERSFYNESPRLYTKHDVENLLEIKEIEDTILKLKEQPNNTEEIYKLNNEIEEKSKKYFKY